MTPFYMQVANKLALSIAHIAFLEPALSTVCINYKEIKRSNHKIDL